MLTIRKEQMTLLAEHMREIYVQKTLKNLAKLFPEDPKAQDETAMRALIKEGIVKAAGYGITGERETSLFIFLMQEHGAGFEKQKDKRWMQRILLNEELEEEQKMDLLYKRLEIKGNK